MMTIAAVGKACEPSPTVVEPVVSGTTWIAVVVTTGHVFVLDELVIVVRGVGLDTPEWASTRQKRLSHKTKTCDVTYSFLVLLVCPLL